MTARVFVEQVLAPDTTLKLDEGPARHLTQVLRFRVGDPFIAFDGRGGEYEASLESVGKREATARIGAFRDVSRESPLLVTLAQCVSKGERMDFALQKGVELGVTAIQPLLSKRSVVRLDDERWEKKHEHWRGVVVSACEQSGRTLVPEVRPVLDLYAWLANTEPALRIVLVPGSGEGLRALTRPERPVTILIGPEGGLDDDEVREAIRHGCEPISLGPRVLRTETAGIAALAALQAIFGDLH
jgi:16S rRNA (uracil1498-N3)-methyltransferase